MTDEQRRWHLLMWLWALPEDVDGPAGMVKALRHMLADLDALIEADRRQREGL